MPDDVFRWVIAVGVILACLASVFQAILVAGLYRAGKEAQKAGKDAQNKIGPLVGRFEAILSTTGKILDENRPRIADITAETLVIAKATRQQAERISELLNDANQRAKARIAQIDRTVDETVTQVEHASEAVKGVITRPVREANGIIAGIKAAATTFAQGGRRPSVEHAT
ncbi:MAG: hypothetical protein ABSH32_09930, partial [Bryobacteraceae bacterium]